MIQYDENNIKVAISILDNLKVTGIDNCERVIKIAAILSDGKEVKDGDRNC